MNRGRTSKGLRGARMKNLPRSGVVWFYLVLNSADLLVLGAAHTVQL